MRPIPSGLINGRLRGATSASGMVYYQGGSFTEDAPQVYVAEPAANLVAALDVTNQGLVINAEQRLYPDSRWGRRSFLASTDERFRPVDVLNGPDGALYIIDFYRGVIQDHVFVSEELKAHIRDRLEKAGVEVIEARISHLAYAPEIAGA